MGRTVALLSWERVFQAEPLCWADVQLAWSAAPTAADDLLRWLETAPPAPSGCRVLLSCLPTAQRRGVLTVLWRERRRFVPGRLRAVLEAHAWDVLAASRKRERELLVDGDAVERAWRTYAEEDLLEEYCALLFDKCWEGVSDASDDRTRDQDITASEDASTASVIAPPSDAEEHQHASGESERVVGAWLKHLHQLRTEASAAVHTSSLPPLDRTALRRLASRLATNAERCALASLQAEGQLPAASAEEVLRAVLLPCFAAATAPIPRPLYAAAAAIARRQPRAVSEALLLPLLTTSTDPPAWSAAASSNSDDENALAAPQADVCVRLLREALPGEIVSETLRRALSIGLRQPWNERALRVLEEMFTRARPRLDAAALLQVASALEAHAASPALTDSGLRFAKLTLAFITHYPEAAATEPCRQRLLAALRQLPPNFLAAAAAQKLDGGARPT
ncbi:hypothetical protein CDCA_CDCA05G1561 [Cyanidium caldarium]|uniref:Fanconi Anaemia group E protein C-terminal domain-containing protein n=1 Tax=Cyanidium caldarium TaxID=2771 RepID=A0AAV9ITN4_CYACA|nr:hypothetical protein CDCA_CDCA05G1561 [Cyanidium caldarium]